MDKVEYICNNLNDIANENIRLVEHALNSEDELFVASLVSKIYYIAYQKSKWFLVKSNFDYKKFLQSLVKNENKRECYVNETKEKICQMEAGNQSDSNDLHQYKNSLNTKGEKEYSHGTIFRAILETISDNALKNCLANNNPRKFFRTLYYKRKVFDYAFKKQAGRENVIVAYKIEKKEVLSMFKTIKAYSEFLDKKLSGDQK